MANPVDDVISSIRSRTSGEGSGGIGRVLKWFLVVIAVAIIVPQFFTYIEPGHVGILIHRAGGGVDAKPLGPGFQMRNPVFSQIEEYPVYMQTLVLTRASTEGSPNNDEINVNSQEGQPLSLDVAMSFELDPTRVPTLYQTFRSNIDLIQHGFVKQTIRQVLQEVVGGEPIADILGPKKAEVVARSQKGLEDRLARYGILVRQFTINETRAPESVIEAINVKNVMQQQALTAQNELQKNEFQARGDSIKAAGRAKAITAEAEAQARANRMLAESMTPTLVQYRMVDKWNGVMPTVAGGGMPMIQLPVPKQ
jgi:regulator of protease activity HflC (stomatin/prohibitin superfamily)